MKKCPKCNKTFDDSWKICLHCRIPLTKFQNDAPQEPVKQEDHPKSSTVWEWLLWWKVSPEELKEQVENYSTLKIAQSARGQSFLLCILAIVMTLIASFSNINAYTEEYSKIGFVIGTIIECMVALVFGFFIYKGHRWAMITMMVLWTVEKFYFTHIRLNEPNPGLQIMWWLFWWCVYMHAFYMAFKIENLKRKSNKVV